MFPETIKQSETFDEPSEIELARISEARIKEKGEALKPAGLRRGPSYDDEVVLSGNESQTTPLSVDLIHAVDEFHNTLPA